MRTIVYGVGTTGKRVVGHLKRRIDAEPRDFGETLVAVIESDVGPTPLFRGGLVVGPEMKDLTNLPKDLPQVWADVRTKKAPTVDAWCRDIDAALKHINPVDWKEGCRQVRPAGRLSLFENYRQYPAECVLPNGLAFSGRSVLTGEPGTTWVFVVGSTAGGTGGGIFLDVCRLAKKKHPQATIVGVLALADAFTANFAGNQMAMAHARANTAAALMELERNMDPFLHDGAVQYALPVAEPAWVPGDPCATDGSAAYKDALDAPLGYCFLVDGLRQDPRGQVSEIHPEIDYDVSRSMAEFIAVLSRADSGPRLRTAISGGAAPPRTFSRFALGTIAYPADDLRAYRALGAALDLIGSHLLGAAEGGEEAVHIPRHLAEDRREDQRRKWGAKHRFLELLIDERYRWGGGSDVLVDDGSTVPSIVLQYSQTPNPSQFRERHRLGGEVPAPTAGDLVRPHYQRGGNYRNSCDLVKGECERLVPEHGNQAGRYLNEAADRAVPQAADLLDTRISELLNDPGSLGPPSPDLRAHARTLETEARSGLTAAQSMMEAVAGRLGRLRDILARTEEAFRGPKGKERDRRALETRALGAYDAMLKAWPDWALSGVYLALLGLVLGVWLAATGRWLFNIPEWLVDVGLVDLADTLEGNPWPWLAVLLALYLPPVILGHWRVRSRYARQRQYIERHQELLFFDVNTHAFEGLRRLADGLEEVVAARREALALAKERLESVTKALENRRGGQSKMLQQRPGLDLLGSDGQPLVVLREIDQQLARRASEKVGWVVPVQSKTTLRLDLQRLGQDTGLGLASEPFDPALQAEVAAEALQQTCFDLHESPRQGMNIGRLLQASGRGGRDYYTNDLYQKSAWMLSLSGGGTSTSDYLLVHAGDPLFPKGGTNVVPWEDPTRVTWVRFEQGLRADHWKNWETTYGEYRRWRVDRSLPEVHTTMQNSVAALLEDFFTVDPDTGPVPRRKDPLHPVIVASLQHPNVQQAFAYALASRAISGDTCRDKDGAFDGLVLGGHELSSDRNNVVGSALKKAAQNPHRKTLVDKEESDRRGNRSAWESTIMGAYTIQKTIDPKRIHNDGLLDDWNDVIHRVLLLALRNQGVDVDKLPNF